MLEIVKPILSKISKNVYRKNYMWGNERSRTQKAILSLGYEEVKENTKNKEIQYQSHTLWTQRWKHFWRVHGEIWMSMGKRGLHFCEITRVSSLRVNSWSRNPHWSYSPSPSGYFKPPAIIGRKTVPYNRRCDLWADQEPRSLEPENHHFSVFDNPKCYLNRWFTRLPTFDIRNLA
jgi:hypothetical protein